MDTKSREILKNGKRKIGENSNGMKVDHHHLNRISSSDLPDLNGQEEKSQLLIVQTEREFDMNHRRYGHMTKDIS